MISKEVAKNDGSNSKLGKPKYGTVYKSTGAIFVIRNVSKGVPAQFVNTKRDDIDCFSASSSSRMRRYLRECTSNYRNMLTLTYPFTYPTNGPAVKEHLRKFNQELLRYSARHGRNMDSCSIFWFLEFQGRGAPHFHLFTTDDYPKDWVAWVWYQIVGSDDSRHLKAGTRIETIRLGKSGIASYAMKYAAKNEQKVVPEGFEHVGRFWGVTGCRATVSAATFVNDSLEAFQGTSRPIFMLNKTINALLLNGDVEMLCRNEGSAVFVVNNDYARKKLAARISALSAVTMNFDQTFASAELDYGETFRARQFVIREKEGGVAIHTLEELENIAAENRDGLGAY